MEGFTINGILYSQELSEAYGVPVAICDDPFVMTLGAVCAVKIQIEDWTEHRAAILVSKYSAEILTANELYAVMMHEVGHIKLGHLDMKLSGFSGGMQTFFNEEAADVYAMKACGGPDLLISGLKKLTAGHKTPGLTNKLFLWYMWLCRKSAVKKAWKRHLAGKL